MSHDQVDIDVPAILIRISRSLDPKQSRESLYESTRGVWKVGDRKDAARYAFAVAGGIVQEVYEIHQWHPAGTTPYATRSVRSVQIPGRWEFTGGIAPEAIRDRFVRR